MSKVYYELRNHQGPGRAGYIYLPPKKIQCPTLSFPRAGKFFEVGEDPTISVAHIPVVTQGTGSLESTGEVDAKCLPAPLIAEGLDATLIKNGLEEVIQTFLPVENPETIAAPLFAFTFLDNAYSFYIKDCLNHGVRYFLLTRLVKYLSRPRLLAKILTTIRRQLSPDSVLHVISPIPPHFIPILAYLGADVVDTGFANLAAASRLFLYHYQVIQADELEMPFCDCQACSYRVENQKDSSIPSEIESWLKYHNIWQYIGEIRKIRLLFRQGGLRELVEAQTHQAPQISALIRILTREFSKDLEATTATFSKTRVICIGSESLHRPEIERFRERIQTRFTPRATPCVLILPCSAKKPYSTSKSHQLYRKAIDRALSRKNRKQLAEVIYTSPLGAIPRELEYTFPVAHYDIPVTGDWSTEEWEITIQALAHLLSKFPKDTYIIAHVDLDQQLMIEKALELCKHDFILVNTKPKVTSQDALAALTTTLRKAFQEVSKLKSVLPPRIRTILAIADYQFGSGANQMLFGDLEERIKIQSWYPRQARIFSGQSHLATLNPSTGQLQLTLESAKKLKDLEAYKVYFNNTYLTGSTLFASGVSHASHEIRPGDEVIIENIEEEIIGTGQAVMNGWEMEEATKGFAVKIRKKRR
ncbi:MAG: DUF5591 domain-containing protein [Candidatus Hodarchaeota archaeon]